MIESSRYGGAAIARGCNERIDATCIGDEAYYYIYYVPYDSAEILRFGPTGDSSVLFTDQSSWKSFDATSVLTSLLKPLASTTAPQGFIGAVSDGRYVYFSPRQSGDGRFLRYATRSTNNGSACIGKHNFYLMTL